MASSPTRTIRNYPYDASKPAAIIFAILFALVLIAHIYQAVRKRAKWMIPIIIGLVMETFGYIARYISIVHITSRNPHIVSEVGLVVAPVLFAAQDYMLVGRMMALADHVKTIIPHRWITATFVGSDILSFLAQVIGALLLTGDHSVQTTRNGRAILIASLIFQVASFAIFLLVAIAFHLKAKRILTPNIMKPFGILFMAFYISGSLIVFRSIFRFVQFITVRVGPTGATGYLFTTEWVLYVFDSIPMFIATAVMNAFHPQDYIAKARDVKSESSGQSNEYEMGTS